MTLLFRLGYGVGFVVIPFMAGAILGKMLEVLCL